MCRLLIVTIMLLPLISCGCGKSGMTKEYSPERIHINTLFLDMQVGDVEILKAQPVPPVAHQPVFRWETSDPSVVTVADGIVTAVSEGSATVSASVGSVRTDVAVRVSAPYCPGGSVLYNLKPDSFHQVAELQLGEAGIYTDEGLNLIGKGSLAKLDKFYALGERMIRYRIRPSSDAIALFQSSLGDFSAYVDVPEKKIRIGTAPVTEGEVPFLKGDRDYDVEIYHIYNVAKVRIIDVGSKETAEISATMDGTGGCGKGALQEGFYVGMQWDHYCFGLHSGSSVLLKRMTVFSLKDKVKLLLYGDSITQPEGYFPTKDFPEAWTQRIIARLGGNAMSSGRGGGTIHTCLEYIKNELPSIKAEYVMVTVGTNGGNTEENLTEIVEYIKEQGSIPILNNIPCNESGTQIANNELIERVRRKTGVNGCRFDIATSLAGDGQEVDKSLMYWEDYTGSYGWQIYHHPNEKGGKKMFDRTLLDAPEIYE